MIITDVNIITPFNILKEHSLIISNGKIDKIIRDEELNDYKNMDIIYGDNKFLAPGFIDIHNHGSMGKDIMDSTEEALDIMGEYHISNGVTSYLGTVITSSYKNMENAIENIVNYKNKDDRSEIIGIHLEGPYFNIKNKGAQPEKYIESPDKEKIIDIYNRSKGLLKMVSLAPELDGALELIKEMSDRDVAVAMAHTNADYEQAIRGIQYGASISTHLYNGMRRFNHREPGVVGASLVDDRVYCEIICDRYHLHDAAMKIAIEMKGMDKIVLVSDAMRAAGLPDGEYDLGGQNVIVKDKKPRLESGSIAGSTLDLREAVYNMVNYLDISLKDAVRMASLNPAKSIGMEKELGSIEIGKKANLVLFDRDIKISDVFIGGKLAWKKN